MMPEQNSNAELPRFTVAELIARSEAEAAHCWRMAGDESLPSDIRYQYAWGAMDWDLNRTLLLESEDLKKAKNSKVGRPKK